MVCASIVVCLGLLSSSTSEARSINWYRVAACETHYNWDAAGTYQGGLGFYYKTWDWWAGELGFSAYRSAGDAPPWVQIQVAQYGYSKYHGYWGCIAHGYY
jgi:Transglycosylase-like domain